MLLLIRIRLRAGFEKYTWSDLGGCLHSRIHLQSKQNDLPLYWKYHNLFHNVRFFYSSKLIAFNIHLPTSKVNMIDANACNVWIWFRQDSAPLHSNFRTMLLSAKWNSKLQNKQISLILVVCRQSIRTT